MVGDGGFGILHYNLALEHFKRKSLKNYVKLLKLKVRLYYVFPFPFRQNSFHPECWSATIPHCLVFLHCHHQRVLQCHRRHHLNRSHRRRHNRHHLHHHLRWPFQQFHHHTLNENWVFKNLDLNWKGKYTLPSSPSSYSSYSSSSSS